jgi:hypothetical protein
MVWINQFAIVTEYSMINGEKTKNQIWQHKWETRFNRETSRMLHILWTHYACIETKYYKEVVMVVHMGGRRTVNTYESLCNYKHGKH